MADIRDFDPSTRLSSEVTDAIARIRARAMWETRSHDVYFDASASIGDNPQRIRSYENTPRERGEISAGLTYTGDWFTLALAGQAVDSPQDGKEFRADGSVVGATIGNFSLTVNTLDRWWGPGWDGSIILSNNARPMPAVSLDRNFTDPFQTKLLSWLGPWDFSMHFARLESDRFVPDAQFLGLRVNFKPLPSLEIGLSRVAQVCGDGRPCNADTFIDLLRGRDNIDNDGIEEDNEPGNQLAGFDVRWATRVFDIPVAFYGQFIGEDEAGRLPSRYLGQFGLEGTGIWRGVWSYRWFGEFAGTSCQFYESSELFNCAYNHGTYRSGYRYRGRSIGHGADNDSRLISFGLVAADSNDKEWNVVFRVGGLNRGGPPDATNSLTPTRQDIVSVDVRHSRVFSFGEFSVGLGFESIDDEVGDSVDDDFRAFLQWRSSY